MIGIDWGAASLRARHQLCAGLALALLAGCGGGGGGTPPPPPPPPPPPTSQPPVFTSGTAVAVAENVGGSIYQAAATDPEGAAVAFSIVGGADAARFSIAPNGALSFVSPPNFDLPTDSDLNNTYLVEIGASDGQNLTRQTVTVTVSNSKEGVSVRRVGTGFVNPAAAAAVSETVVLVAEKNGAIYSFNPQNGSRQLLVQIAPIGGQGVLSIAAAPDFATTGRFVVMYTVNDFIIVHDYLRKPASPTVSSNFGPFFQLAAPDYAGGGWLGYGTDGNLLIATGDAGGTGDPAGRAQNDSSFLGKIVRVTPNPDPYACATICPFNFSRIAKGLHQPVGGFVYPGGLLIGDRGQVVVDEVNHLAPGATGINFGWPFKEGFRIVREPSPANLTDPVTEYLRSSANAIQGIVGGGIASNAVASIAGHYIFADRSGAIFGFPTASLQNARNATERRTADFAPDVGAIEQPVGLVADPAGRLYILDADGDIFRVDAG